MDIVEKIKYLAKENGTDMANIERCVGLGNSSIRRWSNNSPSVNKVLLVANFLKVSVDWLVRDELDLKDLQGQKTANMPLHSSICKDNSNLYVLLSNASEESLIKIEHFLEIANDKKVETH